MQKLGNKRQAYDARECAMTVEAALQKIGDAILVRADEDSIHGVIRMGLAGNSSSMTHCCLTRQQEVGTRCNSDTNLTQDDAVATYTELTSGKTVGRHAPLGLTASSLNWAIQGTFAPVQVQWHCGSAGTSHNVRSRGCACSRH